MNDSERRKVHLAVFALGLILMIGGIAARKPGASIIGLIVAAVNYWQWRDWSKKRS